MVFRILFGLLVKQMEKQKQTLMRRGHCRRRADCTWKVFQDEIFTKYIPNNRRKPYIDNAPPLGWLCWFNSHSWGRIDSHVFRWQSAHCAMEGCWKLLTLGSIVLFYDGVLGFETKSIEWTRLIVCYNCRLYCPFLDKI